MNLAIVGAGLSGTMLLIHLAQIYLKKPFEAQIFLIEAQPNQWGKGIAYSSTLPYQPLNVTAQKMNLSANDPNDFLDWLGKNGYRFGTDSFVPRSIFGDFLSDKLAEAKQILGKNIQLIADKVLNVEPLPNGGYRIELAQTAAIEAHKLVLAVGADTPPDLGKGTDKIFNNPYEPQLIDKISNNARILLLGTGLTMIDWAISLQKKCSPKTIFALSRRGQLPKSHFLQTEKWEINPEELVKICTIRQFIAHFNQNIRLAAKEKNLSWQTVLDTYRSHLCIIWDNFNEQNKRIFLRFLRPYWDSLRFRCPEESAQELELMQQMGIFNPLAGAIISIQTHSAGLLVQFKNKETQQVEILEVDYLINCTGAANFSQKMPLLYQNLVKNGLAKIDKLNIGLETDPEGCIWGDNTPAQNPICALGAVRKAKEWETTSIQSIRNQTLKLAEQLTQQLSAAFAV